MFKFFFLFFFAALVAFVSAKPGVVAPVAYTSPFVSAYSAGTPVVSAYAGAPVVSAYSALPYTSFGAAPVVSTYSGLPLAGYPGVRYY